MREFQRQSARNVRGCKIFTMFLEINLNDSTFQYACQNHNLGDSYVVVELEDITIQNSDSNNCMVLNQLGGENED